jgi:hypothetical protein
VLAAIDRLRETCIALDSAQRIAEAEAALALGRIDRARYGLEQYLARADARDPALARVRRLYTSLPRAESNRDIDQLIGHCRRPLQPSVPDSRFTERAAMQAAESAVRRYRQFGELYLECVARVIESGGLNAAETEAVTKQHNEVVLELTAVQMRFNRTVRELGLSRQTPGDTVR